MNLLKRKNLSRTKSSSNDDQIFDYSKFGIAAPGKQLLKFLRTKNYD